MPRSLYEYFGDKQRFFYAGIILPERKFPSRFDSGQFNHMESGRFPGIVETPDVGEKKAP
jgi:hypothetical protein